MKLSLSIIVVPAFILAVFSADAKESIDRSTQRNGMHSCPQGQFVMGIQVAKNLLLCSDEFGEFVGKELVDHKTQAKIGEEKATLHACPKGMAVTGVHEKKNLLACARPTRTFGGKAETVFVDTDTQREGMHACPQRAVVTGFHSARNLLQCQGAGPGGE